MGAPQSPGWRPAGSLALSVLLGGICLQNVAAAQPVPAFPGAEGAGRMSKGGRGGQVLEVTTLADRGPGSLRAALAAKGPRTIVFGVGGAIKLAGQLRISEPSVTLAGQTAPGDGIVLEGYGLTIAADDVVVRYLRVRPGDSSGKELDTISVSGGSRVIVDHCSASWSVDETVSVSTSGSGVTVQWSIISESLDCSVHSKGCHGYGSLIRGANGSEVTCHHNLYAHHRSRMPRPGNYDPATSDPKGLLFDFRNNVIYNWAGERPGYNSDTDSVTRSNFVANYYLPGPDSNGQLAYRDTCVTCQSYFDGNYMARVEPTDPWDLVRFSGFSRQQERGYKLAAPLPTKQVTTQRAPDAYEAVLAIAGANFPRRDKIDARVVEHVRRRTGRIINSQREVGGWPRLAGGQAPEDTDRDGMPDMWELSHQLNPNDPADGALDQNLDGYTNLEDYLNELVAPPGSTPPLGTPLPPAGTPTGGQAPQLPPSQPPPVAGTGPGSAGTGVSVGSRPPFPNPAGAGQVPPPPPSAGFAAPPPAAMAPERSCVCAAAGAGSAGSASGWLWLWALALLRWAGNAVSPRYRTDRADRYHASGRSSPQAVSAQHVGRIARSGAGTVSGAGRRPAGGRAIEPGGCKFVRHRPRPGGGCGVGGRNHAFGE